MTQMNLNILIVDDEANIRKTLAYCLEAEGHRVFAVSNANDALAENSHRTLDMAFVDLRLREKNGMDLIPALLSESPWIKIVVITAYASIETAVEAMRRGAIDYVAKPYSSEQIKLLTQRIARMRELENQVASLKADVNRIGPEEKIQTNNVAMKRLIETAMKAAASEATVLLRGESGTGKSMFARAIHHWSPRASKPLAVVACPAMPPDLLESELFGHVKGAFTGAVRDNPGRIAACEGGTLFLDEISDLAPSLQAKLLRFIQEKEYERVGDVRVRKANVRIIAASNTDLEKRVQEGLFREDLFYRLNVISLTLPPLRERPEDIGPMTVDFLMFFNRINHKALLGFTDETMNALLAYQWPGNVRELRNVIERAVILGNGERISRLDLPESVAPVSSPPSSGDMVSLSVIEEQHIRRVLAATSSLQEAASILGIDQATLWRRRKTYGI
jgi:two-component system, NtrC family, response regulator AlgB